jgi:hypothetical protein
MKRFRVVVRQDSETAELYIRRLIVSKCEALKRQHNALARGKREVLVAVFSQTFNALHP